MKQGPKPVKFLLSPWVVPKPHPHLLKSQSPKHCEWKWLTISHTSKEPTVSSKLGKRSIPAISSHVQSHNEIKMQILWCCQEGSIMMDVPPHTTMHQLVALAEDKSGWMEFVRETHSPESRESSYTRRSVDQWHFAPLNQ